MTKLLVSAALLIGSSLFAEGTIPVAGVDPLKALSFLEGTWEAKTQGGSAGAQSAGTYVFQMELKHHVLGRHSNNDAGCKGPVDFDCNHSDLLYIFPDEGKKTLKAIYFDNEGHVIHYIVTVPQPTLAVFLSDPSNPGPQFQLVYELINGTMFGRFQIRMPGDTAWKTYLDWSGGKK